MPRLGRSKSSILPMVTPPNIPMPKSVMMMVQIFNDDDDDDDFNGDNDDDF